MVARTLIHGRLGISATNSTVRVSLSSGWSSDSFVCRACRQNLQRRNASAATALAEPTPAPLDQRCPPVIESTAPHRTFEIKAGVVLSRPPLITRDLTPFEREYFFYQRRLNERLVLPFTRYFYYPKDTPGEIRWKRKMKERQIAGRDLAGYNPYKEDGWNDELLVGDPASDPQGQLETVLNDALADQQEQGAEEANGDQQAPTSSAEKRRIEEQVVERPYPRSTEADEKKDFRSLNRALSRTLYLLVKEEQGPWQFPYTGLQAKEDLLRASERLLVQTGGINMNTWVLGRAPVGHCVRNFARPKSEDKLEKLGEKIFYMKARIMAGQLRLADNTLNLSDFKWLAKEEIEQEVRPGYWKAIKHMLVDL